MASPSSSEFSQIIDWTEAMEQCGDDEEFLHELLGDLKGEIDTQIVKMDGVLEVSCVLVYMLVYYVCCCDCCVVVRQV